MKTFKFLELSNKAKKRACEDYLKGWRETHEDFDLSMLQVYEILRESNDNYTSEGELWQE